jgi:quercetin dioxygenase-like cupin family protein
VRILTTRHLAGAAIAALLISVLTPLLAGAQLMSTCAPNSPERRGEDGCSIFDSKLLPDGLKGPLFWHIDRFDSLEQARAAAGPSGVAFDAAGAFWLMSIEAQTTDHHGGRHVSQTGPLPLPNAPKLSMMAMSAVFAPGTYSLPHHHSGVEAVYVLEGHACYETPDRGYSLKKGESAALPTGMPMRAVVMGTSRRHVLAVIVHDAAQPATMRMDEHTGPKLTACK